MDTQMDKIETDWTSVILKKVGPTFFKFIANRLDKGCFCSGYLVCECSDNFICDGIKQHHFRVLNS